MWWGRLRTILVLLLVGAVVNVAVAWGAILAGALRTQPTRTWAIFDSWPTRQSATTDEYCPANHWTVVIERRLGYESASWHAGPVSLILDADVEFNYSGARWWHLEGAEAYELGDAVAAGWPMLALSGAELRTIAGANDSKWLWRVPFPSSNGVAHEWDVLPCRPMMFSCAVNTLFYTAFLYLLVFGPRFAHKVIRMWRRQCVDCGYPRGKSSVCSECGAALTAVS